MSSPTCFGFSVIGHKDGEAGEGGCGEEEERNSPQSVVDLAVL